MYKCQCNQGRAVVEKVVTDRVVKGENKKIKTFVKAVEGRFKTAEKKGGVRVAVVCRHCGNKKTMAVAA